MSRFALAIVILWAGVCDWGLGDEPPQASTNLKLESNYLKESSSFVTAGKLGTRVRKETLCAVVTDLKNYRTWALEKINEKLDGGKFIIQVTDLALAPEHHLNLVYDIDLPWPFNLKAQSIGMKSATEDAGIVKNGEGVQLVLAEPTFSVKKFEAALKCISSESESNLEFKFDIKLNPMLNIFFSEKVYRKNVESRIRRVMLNLEKHLEK